MSYIAGEKKQQPTPMASGGSQASPIPDLQSLSSPRHGCSPRSSENCCLNKETFLLAENAESRGSLCKRCTVCGRCKAAMRGHGELQQLRHSAFNERVSMDLIVPLHRTDRGNEYIVMMQDHFTKWIECMLVADVIVHEWVYKHCTPLNLHSDRRTEFTAVMHRCLCDLLRIHKTYSTEYNHQSSSAVERCNRTLLSMLRTVVSEQ